MARWPASRARCSSRSRRPASPSRRSWWSTATRPPSPSPSKTPSPNPTRIPTSSSSPAEAGSCRIRAWQDGTAVSEPGTCDADGKFELTLQPGVSGRTAFELEVSGRLRAVVEVEVPEGGTGRLPPVALGFATGVTGQVIDGRGTPKAGVAVEAMPNPNLAEPEPWRATTDAEGNFTFDTLPPRTRCVPLRAARLRSDGRRGLRAAGRDPARPRGAHRPRRPRRRGPGRDRADPGPPRRLRRVASADRGHRRRGQVHVPRDLRWRLRDRSRRRRHRRRPSRVRLDPARERDARSRDHPRPRPPPRASTCWCRVPAASPSKPPASR